MLGRAGFDALGFAIGSERGRRFVVWEHTALGRPAWPALVLGLVLFLVSAQLLEDSVTDSSFKTAQCFTGAFAFSKFAAVVNAAGCIESDLGDGRDVNCPVESPVP